MLSIIFLYWLGKYFYKLAEEYDKNKWGFAILGIVVYYAGTFFFGALIGIILGLTAPDTLENMNEMLLGLLMIPFGILSCYILYKQLEKNWERNKPVNEIDQIGSSNLE
ncbi:MAG: hypothetical protein HRU50_10545 [Winogradskyella sp.]|uniref:hypothetical protein n=1 Tax=Winogradskyella sp. TaxID=1883156 RepID=UPI0025DDFBD8|nr:hypothetical protein [Winogradskyella sp.]NRB60359.1 hypothetical protein [Winogradskyella sp.]